MKYPLFQSIIERDEKVARETKETKPSLLKQIQRNIKQNKNKFMASGDVYFREYDYEELYSSKKKISCTDSMPFKLGKDK